MPSYTYYCKNEDCRNYEIDWPRINIPMAERNNQRCPECGELLGRRIDAHAPTRVGKFGKGGNFID